jgi:glycine/D-amino acid oxidase-like deaminating enzyme
MIVGRAEDEARFEHDQQELQIERLTFAEAQQMVPILHPAKITFAGYHPSAWDIDTDRMIQDFARQVRSTGGAVLTGQTVTAITREDQGWRVDTPDASYTAKKLVNAAGAWADQIALMAGIAPIGITPYRRSMARLPAPGGHDVSSWPIFFGAGERWYAKPDAGKLLVSPAEQHAVTPQDAYADDMVLAEGLARYEEMVTEPVTRVETNWAGLRSFVPDRTLVLGPDPDQPDFIWSAGQGGYGFQTAPAASQLVADLVGGRPSALNAATVAALTPGRLRP